MGFYVLGRECEEGVKGMKEQCLAYLIPEGTGREMTSGISSVTELMKRTRFIGSEELIYDIYGEKPYKSGNERKVLVSHQLEKSIQLHFCFALETKTFESLAIFNTEIGSLDVFKEDYLSTIQAAFEVLDSKGIIQLTNDPNTTIVNQYWVSDKEKSRTIK